MVIYSFKNWLGGILQYKVGKNVCFLKTIQERFILSLFISVLTLFTLPWYASHYGVTSKVISDYALSGLYASYQESLELLKGAIYFQLYTLVGNTLDYYRCVIDGNRTIANRATQMGPTLLRHR